MSSRRDGGGEAAMPKRSLVGHPKLTDEAVRARLGGRYRRERRLRFYSVSAVVLALSFLLFLFVDIVRKGWSGFLQTVVALDVTFDPAIVDPAGTREATALANADYAELWRAPLKSRFAASGREERR